MQYITSDTLNLKYPDLLHLQSLNKSSNHILHSQSMYIPRIFFSTFPPVGRFCRTRRLHSHRSLAFVVYCGQNSSNFMFSFSFRSFALHVCIKMVRLSLGAERMRTLPCQNTRRERERDKVGPSAYGFRGGAADVEEKQCEKIMYEH